MANQVVNKPMNLCVTLLKRTKFRRFGVRTFLSEAYACDAVWENRLNSPLLRNLKMNTYFLEVDKKFQTKRLASGADIDMFANNVTDQDQLDELEHLLYRFRCTKRSCEVLESTHYATVRAFLKFNEFDSLFRILRDRVDYGVFPNAHAYNLLMDKFCNLERYRDAAEIAVLMMLQEDFSDPISRILGLYSCHKFLTECPLESYHPKPDSDNEDNEEDMKKASAENDEEILDEEEGEDEYVRVPYLRNPWFDDHFDLKDPKALLGKTFYLIGREEKNVLGWSCQLIGLGMYEKWEKAASLMDKALQDQSAAFFKDEVIKFKSLLSEIKDDEAKNKLVKEFEDKFQKLKNENKLQDGNIADAIHEATKLIPTLEKSDMEKQEQLFLQWEKDRQSAFEAEQSAILKEKKIQEIAKIKEDLYWKEKLLFFYETEDSIMAELKKVDEIVEIATKKNTADVYAPPKTVMKKPSKISKLRKLALIKKL